MRSSGGSAWGLFTEVDVCFGIKINYDEKISTTTINKSHPEFKHRVAEADNKAKEITNILMLHFSIEEHEKYSFAQSCISGHVLPQDFHIAS